MACMSRSPGPRARRPSSSSTGPARAAASGGSTWTGSLASTAWRRICPASGAATISGRRPGSAWRTCWLASSRSASPRNVPASWGFLGRAAHPRPARSPPRARRAGCHRRLAPLWHAAHRPRDHASAHACHGAIHPHAPAQDVLPRHPRPGGPAGRITPGVRARRGGGLRGVRSPRCAEPCPAHRRREGERGPIDERRPGRGPAPGPRPGTSPASSTAGRKPIPTCTSARSRPGSADESCRPSSVEKPLPRRPRSSRSGAWAPSSGISGTRVGSCGW